MLLVVYPSAYGALVTHKKAIEWQRDYRLRSHDGCACRSRLERMKKPDARPGSIILQMSWIFVDMPTTRNRAEIRNF